MKRLTIILAAVLLALAAPAMAMHHDKGGHGDHGQMQKAGHDSHAGMMKDAATAMLGDQTVEGVKAMSHVRDVKAAMAKMGMKENYHMMVMFSDGGTGAPISDGKVAVKVTDPAGRESGPIEMMAMEGQFGADLALTEKGEYRFEVGTRLADGKTRQFQFRYTRK